MHLQVSEELRVVVHQTLEQGDPLVVSFFYPFYIQFRLTFVRSQHYNIVIMTHYWIILVNIVINLNNNNRTRDPKYIGLISTVEIHL